MMGTKQLFGVRIFGWSIVSIGFFVSLSLLACTVIAGEEFSEWKPRPVHRHKNLPGGWGIHQKGQLTLNRDGTETYAGQEELINPNGEVVDTYPFIEDYDADGNLMNRQIPDDAMVPTPVPEAIPITDETHKGEPSKSWTGNVSIRVSSKLKRDNPNYPDGHKTVTGSISGNINLDFILGLAGKPLLEKNLWEGHNLISGQMKYGYNGSLKEVIRDRAGARTTNLKINYADSMPLKPFDSSSYLFSHVDLCLVQEKGIYILKIETPSFPVQEKWTYPDGETAVVDTLCNYAFIYIGKLDKNVKIISGTCGWSADQLFKVITEPGSYGYDYISGYIAGFMGCMIDSKTIDSGSVISEERRLLGKINEFYHENINLYSVAPVRPFMTDYITEWTFSENDRDGSDVTREGSLTATWNFNRVRTLYDQ